MMTVRWAHPVWGTSLQALRRSVYADQVMTSMVDEWRQLPSLADAVRAQKLVDVTSQSGNYRNIAAGHLIRLHFIPSTQGDELTVIVPSLVAAMHHARLADKHAKTALRNIPFQAGEGFSWPEMAQFWHSERGLWLRVASSSLRKVIPEDVWAKGRAMADGSSN